MLSVIVHVNATYVHVGSSAWVSTHTAFWDVVEGGLGSRESGAGGDEDEGLHCEDVG